MLNITLQTTLDKSALLSTKAEDNFKLAVAIMPSDQIRTKFTQEGHAFNRGVDYCVVVDKTCDRLAEITEAIRALSLAIKHNDTLSLITYSDGPQVIMDSLTSIEAINKMKEITVIQGDSRNSNLYLGLKQAREVMMSKDNERIKKVLLISGLRKSLNHAEEDMLNDEIEKYKQLNISIDTLGIGEESNLFVLDNIASVLGGQGHLVSTNTDISRIAIDSLQYCQNSILTNVKLKIRLNNKYFRLRHIYRGLPTNAYLGKGSGRDEIVININNMHIDKKQYYYFDIVSKIPKLGVEAPIDAAIIGVEYSIPSSSKRGEVMQRKGQRLPIKFVIDESKIQVNHAFINVYSEAEIKRLESIMIDSKKKNEKEAVIYAYNQIINICQEIGNAKLARDYKDSLEEYKRSNIIVTKATSESSKSSINDNLPIL